MKIALVLLCCILVFGCADFSSKTEDSVPITATLKVTASQISEGRETPYYNQKQLQFTAYRMMGETVLKATTNDKYPNSHGMVDFLFIGTLYKGEHVKLCVKRGSGFEEVCQTVTYGEAVENYKEESGRALVEKEVKVLIGS
ncbi:MAG: hypothetical protein ABIF01_00130 [Candidatus Micrarchaeota archaeon]